MSAEVRTSSASSFTEVLVAPTAERAIREHGVATYPEEACGMLLGPLPPADVPGPRPRLVDDVRAVPNRRTEERTHRFLIPADELLRVERELDGSGRGVLGFYHSHPDHPARPSEFDRDHAWPWYAYLVLRVASGVAEELGAFELDPEVRVFQPRGLSLRPVPVEKSGRDPPQRKTERRA